MQAALKPLLLVKTDLRESSKQSSRLTTPAFFELPNAFSSSLTASYAMLEKDLGETRISGLDKLNLPVWRWLRDSYEEKS